MARRLPAVTLPHVQRLPVAPAAGHGSPEWWDELRSSDTVYGIPDGRAAWLKTIDTPDLREAAAKIVTVVDALAARRVVSYGVGRAGIEYLLARSRPRVELVCTDNTPRAVARLAELFEEAELRVHDLAADAPIAADLHLLYRIDTEFSDVELRGLIGRFPEPVLLVPGELLRDSASLAQAELEWQARPGAFTGYRRTEARMRELWDGSHTARAAGGGYLLRRRHAPLPQRVVHHWRRLRCRGLFRQRDRVDGRNVSGGRDHGE